MFELTITITSILFILWAIQIVQKAMRVQENKTFTNYTSWIFQRIKYGLSLSRPIHGYSITNKLLTLANITTFVGFCAITAYIFEVLFANAIDYIFLLEMVILSILSDVEDGACARSLNECTVFGALSDPLRDRYFILIILIHISIVSPTLIFLVLCITAIELHILKMNKKFSTSVHFVGKIRMGIHMLCAIIFTIQNTEYDLIFYVNNLVQLTHLP